MKRRTKPWWKSRTMVTAFIGIAIAIGDGLTTWAGGGQISWRTALLAVLGAVTAWGRKNATDLIADAFGEENAHGN